MHYVYVIMINTSSLLSFPIFPGQLMRAFTILALVYSSEEDNAKCEICGPQSERVAMLERVKIYLFIIFLGSFFINALQLLMIL